MEQENFRPNFLNESYKRKVHLAGDTSVNKYFIKLAFTIVLFANNSHAEMREEFSKFYTLKSLLRGLEVFNISNVPETISKEWSDRSILDDTSYNLQIVFHKDAYKVISFGTRVYGNENTFVLAVFDKFGNFVGRCTADYDTKCNLHQERK